MEYKTAEFTIIMRNYKITLNMVNKPIHFCLLGATCEHFFQPKDVLILKGFVFQIQGTPFVETDIELFEAFAIFCGIGIHNTKMYEGACKLMAKQKVALDCLSYHASASDQVGFNCIKYLCMYLFQKF